MGIREYLKQNKLIADGSFGTYYANRYQSEEAPELANILHPERVVDIHRAYIEAGARLIRTNTFASNTVFLHADMDVVKRNIAAAVMLAERAVKECEGVGQVYIAGDIGPIPRQGIGEGTFLEEQYYQIARCFVDAGLRILNFETFSDMEHILPAIHRIKTEQEVFAAVSFSVNQFGYTDAGLGAGRLLTLAAETEDIDAIGLNCGVGPGHMEQLLRRICFRSDKPFMALPNAGYPKRIRNRLQFADNAEYFAGKARELSAAGADIIGGCCGTSPAFIRRLADTLDMRQQEKMPKTVVRESHEKKVLRRGFLYNADGSVKRKRLIAVELAPPVDADDGKLLAAAYTLADAGVDVLTFPDSPSGRTRIDSVLMAEKVKRETGMEVMPHICCRDKNAIAMRSLLMGAHINDINNMLIITGDPIPSMARQSVKAVFNFDSVGLMNIAAEMNEEMFLNCPMSYGGAINQSRVNQDVEIMRVKRKLEAGAEFFLTQPVFTREDAERLRHIREQTGARILCGIMPLVSRRNALFMKNEISGIPVTDEIVARFPEHAAKEEGEAIGVAIAREVISYTEDFADGYYFSFPFNRVYLLKQIL